MIWTDIDIDTESMLACLAGILVGVLNSCCLTKGRHIQALHINLPQRHEGQGLHHAGVRFRFCLFPLTVRVRVRVIDLDSFDSKLVK